MAVVTIIAIDRVQCVNGREFQHEQTITEKNDEGVWRRQRGSSALARLTGGASDGDGRPSGTPPVPRPGPGTRGENSTRGSQKNFQNSNDPSAGSPTETLLRLLHFKPP